jgi:hypothetical protein
VKETTERETSLNAGAERLSGFARGSKVMVEWETFAVIMYTTTTQTQELNGRVTLASLLFIP